MDPSPDPSPGATTSTLPQPSATGVGRQLLLVLLMAAALFGVYLVNIGRQDFTNASENVVIEAALEARRGGPWWVPNMHGRPRILKPPLPTWIAAAAMSPQTVAATQTGTLPQREAAYHQLAAEARWPSALAAALAVVGTWWLASILIDGTAGLAAAAICGSTVLLLRFGRMANTDVQLTLWVVLANASLAAALLRGQWWKGCLGAGVFLGLAMMCKGPVGLAQSILPAIAFGIYRRVFRSEGEQRPPVNLAAIGTGLAIMLVIALPWPITIVTGVVPNALQVWATDITGRSQGKETRVAHWWAYINLVPNLLPWAPVFIGGLCLPFIKRFHHRGLLYAWFLFVVPLVVMSFFRDKNERYGLPMVPAAAILSAYLLTQFARNRAKLTWSDRAVEHIQWIAALLMAAAPVAGALSINGNPPFYSWTAASLIAATSMALVLAARLAWRRVPWAIIAAPAAISLIVYHCAMVAYSASPDGRSEFKLLALRMATEHPQAQFLFDEGGTGRHIPTDLAIYSGRVVRSAARADLSSAPTQEQLLFTIQKRGSEPKPLDGWTLLTSEQIEDRPCNVYIRKP